MRTVKHLTEALALLFIFAVFRLLPLDTASRLGGALARAIGPRMQAHKTAQNNLAMAFPEYPEEKRREILHGMWDNLGRVAAEIPWLIGDRLFARIHTIGLERLPKPGETVIFFSGHLGNWELLGPTAYRNGAKTTLVYRRANNPLADRIVNAIRARRSATMLPKGPKGAIKLLRALKNGDSLAMLVDQKMNDGIPVPFFGHTAMTAPAVAQLALKYDLPIVPVRVVRLKGAHFTWELFPPLVYEKTGNAEKDTLAVMTRINQILESWIREHPEQWFWVHKRWPNSQA